jgi:hypothetical protein
MITAGGRRNFPSAARVFPDAFVFRSPIAARSALEAVNEREAPPASTGGPILATAFTRCDAWGHAVGERKDRGRPAKPLPGGFRVRLFGLCYPAHMRSAIWIGIFVGSTIGGLVPELWGGDMMSYSGVLLSGAGAFVGLWLGSRASR